MRGISLSLPEGNVLALVGKSGSGKTTLLRCIYGLEVLNEGDVWVDGDKVTGPDYNLIPGHPDMRLVSQDYYVLDNHTVEENIHDKLIGYTYEARHRRTTQLLKLLELELLKTTRARNLSSGQRQRVAIARALAILPKVLLFDEPFSNLDKLLTEKLYAFVINEVRKKRTSLILVTHMAEEALKYADSLAIVDQGKITQQGAKWDVYYNPLNSRLAGLLGDFNTIVPADIEKQSTLNLKRKLFLRPDRLKLTTAKHADILLTIANCTFNGKCYELLTETKTGNSCIVYTERSFTPGKTMPFCIK